MSRYRPTAVLVPALLGATLISACTGPIPGTVHAASPLHLLQGSWQSLDAPKSRVRFSGTAKQDIYDGAIEGEELIRLGKSCQDATSGSGPPPAGENRYIAEPATSLCWYIVEIDKNRLTLSFSGRGNSLRYRRISD